MNNHLEYFHIIQEQCLNCHLCECIHTTSLLNTESLGSLAQQLLKKEKITDKLRDTIFGCDQCGFCLRKCPMKLDIKEFMFHARGYIESIDNREQCKYNNVRIDQKDNLFNKLKQAMVIKYDDALKKNNDCSRLFLPSCHLTSKFPKLTYNTVQYLKDIDLIDGMTEYCCGQPLYAAGLYREFIEYEKKLNQKLIEHQVQTIITPCPNCFYFCQRLQKMGYMKNINIQCLSEELVNRGIKIDRQKYPQIQTISIHDSCPDRHHGYFSKSLRDLLNDFQIIELPHNKENTICCGCGGLVLAYKSEFAQAGIDNKVKDYMEVKTDAVITTCFNCFDSLHNHLPIHHYLELLIEEVDYEKYQNAKLKI